MISMDDGQGRRPEGECIWWPEGECIRWPEGECIRWPEGGYMHIRICMHGPGDHRPQGKCIHIVTARVIYVIHYHSINAGRLNTTSKCHNYWL